MIISNEFLTNGIFTAWQKIPKDVMHIVLFSPNQQQLNALYTCLLNSLSKFTSCFVGKYIILWWKEIIANWILHIRGTDFQRSVSAYKLEVFISVQSLSHHHHIALVAWISLTLSRHSSLSFIALGRSSGQQPVSSHSCWMYVRAGRPAFARPCVGIHKSTSLMSSSLLL